MKAGRGRDARVDGSGSGSRAGRSGDHGAKGGKGQVARSNRLPSRASSWASIQTLPPQRGEGGPGCLARVPRQPATGIARARNAVPNTTAAAVSGFGRRGVLTCPLDNIAQLTCEGRQEDSGSGRSGIHPRSGEWYPGVVPGTHLHISSGTSHIASDVGPPWAASRLADTTAKRGKNDSSRGTKGTWNLVLAGGPSPLLSIHRYEFCKEYNTSNPNRRSSLAQRVRNG